jgi:hypothetical protein
LDKQTFPPSSIVKSPFIDETLSTLHEDVWKKLLECTSTAYVSPPNKILTKPIWDGKAFWQFCINKKQVNNTSRAKLEEKVIVRKEMSWSTAQKLGSEGYEKPQDLKFLAYAAAEHYGICSRQLFMDAFVKYCLEIGKKGGEDEVFTQVQAIEANKGIKNYISNNYPDMTFMEVLKKAQEQSRTIQSKNIGKKRKSITSAKIEDKSVVEKCILLEKMVKPLIYINSKAKGAALSPLNHAHTLHGRKNEKEKLTAFLDDESLFEFMFIIAPSGAGKTRLITQWLKDDVMGDAGHNHWQGGLIEDEACEENWKAWTSKPLACDTVLIVDYIYRFKKIVSMIMEKGAGFDNSNTQGKPHLRLIVLDHILPKDVDGGIHWDMLGGRSDRVAVNLENMEKYPPMRLEHTEEMLTNIIRDFYENKADEDYDTNVITAYRTLLDIDEGIERTEGDEVKYAAQPLFAILIGQALNTQSINEIQSWQRRELIGQYFNDKRLPWEAGVEKGQWVGAAIAAATVLQDLPFETIVDNLTDYGVELNGKEEKTFKETCNRFISSYDNKILKKFVPDILGETLFFMFYEHYWRVTKKNQRTEKDVISLFFNLLCHQKSEKDNHPKANIRFIEFVVRTVRNLLNDSQNSQHAEDSWLGLVRFLTAKNFTNESMQLSASIASIDVAYLISQKQSVELPETQKLCLENVNIEQLLQFPYQFALDKKHGPAMNRCWRGNQTDLAIYFDLLVAKNLLSPSLEKQLHRFLNVADTINFECPSEVVNACTFGNANLLGWIIQNIPDIDFNGDVEMRPLLVIAAYNGHKNVVEKLLSVEHVRVNERGINKCTALIDACISGYIDVVSMLLSEEDIDLNLANDEGKTAIEEAVKNGHMDIVLLLLVEYEIRNIEYPLSIRSALID